MAAAGLSLNFLLLLLMFALISPGLFLLLVLLAAISFGTRIAA